MLPTGTDFFFAFHGVLRAGGVPVPLYPPVRAEQIEDHARRLAAVLHNAGTRLFIASPRTRVAGRVLQALVPDLRATVTIDELRHSREPAQAVPRAGDDLAFLQYTSGTTGVPKGVMLTHANLLANIRAMGPAVEAGPGDRFVSWLPLYHDMGLIGACLATLYYGVEIILMSPLQFMARPERWLWAIHHHGGTISAGPNFAYDLCAGRIEDAQLEGLDLSSWRLAFNGAEPVRARTLERFAERFAPYGLDPAAIMPVYGLAESSVGLAFPPLGRGARIDRVRRPALERERHAEPAPDDETDVLRFVSCGHVLHGHELRIVGDDGRPLPEREEGRVQFRGPSCTRGYFRNEAATHALFAEDDWREAGDRGYLANGEIHLTGRIKDIIIRAGRNLHPEEIEAAVADVPGIRKNNVAAFASPDPGGGSERLVIMAETRQTDVQQRDALRQAATRAASAVLDGPPDDLVLVPPRTIAKTSSGKIRRSSCRELYEGGLRKRQRGVALQAARLLAASAASHLRSLPARLGRYGFAGWCWLLGLVLGLPGAVLMVATPGARARAAIARGGCRLLLGLAGIRARVDGDPAVAARAPAVLVANHASYLDGLILRAVLPGPLFFVAKRELARHWPVRVFLQRIGVEFVERGDHQRGLSDLERIRARAAGGEPMLAFPEGTFSDGAGVRGFRVGPFMVAVQAALPVVPIALHGTRRLLRGSSLLPAPSRVAVTIGTPLQPGGDDWTAALALRDRARAFIVAHCGEPDLAPPGPSVAGNL
jgi:1-acyl-sn-glycerol-3-phosphate acyltransferase